MRKFEDINDIRIVKKKIIRVQAWEKAEFDRILKPNETVNVCNCLIKTKYGNQILITGVKYQSVKWEHVLVRTVGRYPTYREMILAKEMFWRENEIAFQVYPKQSQNVNIEEFTLHLWRDLERDPVDELVLQKKLEKGYKKAKKEFDGKKKSFFISDENGGRIVIYGPMYWLTWEEMVKEKERFLGTENPGIQMFMSKDVDDNSEYVSMIWETKKFRFPPKELV